MCTESKPVFRSIQSSMQPSVIDSVIYSAAHFFSPNGKGLSGVFVALAEFFFE